MRLMVFFFLLVFYQASSQEAILHDADKAMASGKYAQALTLYKQIDSMGYGSQALFANMAIASASLNQHAYVVLYLEKAKKYNPSSEKLRLLSERLLQDSQSFITEEGMYSKLVNGSTGFLSDDGWAWLSLFFFSLLITLLGIKMISTRKTWVALSRWIQWQILFLSIATTGCILAARYRHNQIYKNTGMIIISPDCPLKMGPDNQSPDLILLEAGTKVEFQESLGEWWEVETPQGEKGWIRASMALRI